MGVVFGFFGSKSIFTACQVLCRHGGTLKREASYIGILKIMRKSTILLQKKRNFMITGYIRLPHKFLSRMSTKTLSSRVYISLWPSKFNVKIISFRLSKSVSSTLVACSICFRPCLKTCFSTSNHDDNNYDIILKCHQGRTGWSQDPSQKVIEMPVVEAISGDPALKLLCAGLRRNNANLEFRSHGKEKASAALPNHSRSTVSPLLVVFASCRPLSPFTCRHLLDRPITHSENSWTKLWC